MDLDYLDILGLHNTGDSMGELVVVLELDDREDTEHEVDSVDYAGDDNIVGDDNVAVVDDVVAVDIVVGDAVVVDTVRSHADGVDVSVVVCTF